MDLAPILTRLKSQLAGFKTVGSAAEMDAIGKGIVPVPSCYLVPMSEAGEDSELIGGFEQRLRVVFSVILVTSNAVDSTGAGALSGLEGLRRKIKSALLGWAPDPATGEAVGFASGQLLRFDDNRLWWADEFRVTTYERTL